MSKNTGYVINREMYKRIKDMDHKTMDEFLRSFAKKHYANDNLNEEAMKSAEIFHAKCMLEALENTKGIGEKIRESFLNNYKNIKNEKLESLKIANN